MIDEGLLFFGGIGAGVGGSDGQCIEIDQGVGEDREGAFLGAEGGGLAVEPVDEAFDADLACLEVVACDDAAGVVAGAVDAFARREALEGLGDLVLVLPELGDARGEPGEPEGLEAVDGHGVDIGPLGSLEHDGS